MEIINKKIWENIKTSNGKSYPRKIIRSFKDKKGNEFKIYKLTNNHNELTIKETGVERVKIIKGTRGEIIGEINKYWKGKGTFTNI